MFGLSDAECLLLGWAVGATIAMFKYREERNNLGQMLKVLFMEPEARGEIFEKFDEFRKKYEI